MNRETADDLSGDLEKYPGLEEYKASLKSLLAMDLAALSYDELSDLFYGRAILFQQAYGMTPPEYFNERNFFRVRFNLLDTEDPDLIRTHSYPLGSACSKNGRANVIGKSVFYCSENPGTAILETRPSPADIGYLGVWEGRAERQVKYGICLPKELRAENIFRRMAVEIDNVLIQQSSKAGGEKAEHLIYLYRLIADRFVNEQSPYPFTSWVANEMLYKSQPKDYIIYPSIASSQITCNLAFHPNSADTLLRFQKVWRFRLVEIAGPFIKTTEHQIGELDKSQMRWRKPHPGELLKLMPGGEYS